MKTLLTLLAILTLSAACSPKNGGNAVQNPENVAAISLPNECLGPQPFQNGNGFQQAKTGLPWQSIYQQEIRQANCRDYRWDRRGNFQEAGCRPGTFAACGAGIGMICVPSQALGRNEVAWYNYAQGPRQMTFCGYEGQWNQGACAYRSIQGAGNIGRACIRGEPNACGGYGQCRRIARNSRVGVCVR